MTQLREFRARLAEDDVPAARERARRRLSAAQNAPLRAAPPARRVRFAAVGAFGLAVALAGVLVGVGPGGSDDGLAPAPASARGALVRAAQEASALRDGGIPRMPRPDEYFYLEIRGTYRDGFTGRDGRTRTALHTRTYRRWQSFTRTGRIETGDGAPSPASESRLDPFIGNERFSARELAAFDPTPRELYERLLHDISPGQGSSPTAEVFVQLVDALRDVPLGPRQRATFLRALAEVPGLVLTGPTTDALGRPGVGIAYVDRSRQDERHSLVLSAGGALLAVHSTTADGQLLEDAVIVHQAITSDLRAP